MASSYLPSAPRRRRGRPARFEVREAPAPYHTTLGPARVLVDTNVLIDVFASDPRWFDWSSAQLARVIDTRQAVINPIVYAEVAATFEAIEALDAALNDLAMLREHLPWPAAFLASKAHRRYRARGGKREQTLADFFIGAHAAIADYTLLTRDGRRYREYFPKLRVIAP